MAFCGTPPPGCHICLGFKITHSWTCHNW